MLLQVLDILNLNINILSHNSVVIQQVLQVIVSQQHFLNLLNSEAVFTKLDLMLAAMLLILITKQLLLHSLSPITRIRHLNTSDLSSDLHRDCSRRLILNRLQLRFTKTGIRQALQTIKTTNDLLNIALDLSINRMIKIITLKYQILALISIHSLLILGDQLGSIALTASPQSLDLHNDGSDK